jgi:MFS family permease
MTNPTTPASSATHAGAAHAHWQRNLAVCMFGSFTTIVAMTLLLPFLPLYVEQLGVKDHAAIVQWSGVAYGATFFSRRARRAAVGPAGDRYGRKLMLMRASLGMAVAISLIGMAGNVWQLVGLRLLVGAGSAATPRARWCWSPRRRPRTAPPGRWARCPRASWPATSSVR